MNAAALHRAWVVIVLGLIGIGICGTVAGQPVSGRSPWAECGLPVIENFLTSSLRLPADATNWCSIRDARGILHVGNSDGILEYDGAVWRILKSKNGSPVFSLALGNDGIVYFGLHGAFGRIVADDSGHIHMDLLSDRLPESDRDFSYVYGVHAVGNAVWFRSAEGLFCWDGSNLNVIHRRNIFKQSHVVEGLLYVLIENVGLHLVGKTNVTLVPGGDALSTVGESVYFILPAGNGRLLVGTKLHGMLFYDGKEFTPAWTPAIRAELPKEPSCGVLLADSTWAIGTFRRGIWIIDRQGTVRRVFNTGAGLQDNGVISINVDKENMLWAALDNGLSRIAWPSSVTSFGRNSRLEGKLLDLARYQGRIYLATTQGAFRLRDGVIDPEGIKTKHPSFEMLTGFPSECFALLTCADELLLASPVGVYSYDGKTRRLLTRASARVLHPIHRSLDSVLVGLEKGLLLLTRRNAQWMAQPIFGEVDGTIQSIVEGPDKTTWISQADGAVFALTPNRDFVRSPVRQYLEFQQSGANPADLGVVQGLVWMGTQDTFCVFNAVKDRFEPDPKFWRKLGVPQDWSVRMPFQDKRGRIWMQLDGRSRRYAYASQESGAMGHLTLIPDLEQTSVNFIKAPEDGVVWFGTESELFRFEDFSAKQAHSTFNVFIRAISQETKDWYTGDNIDDGSRMEIPFSDEGVHIRFAAPSFVRADRMQYRWKLAGLNDNWTEWSFVGKVDYPALSEGLYTFKVEARGADGAISEEANISFRILPPWQRSWWAYALYGIFAIGIFIAALRYRTRKLEEKSRALEQTIRDRTEEIRSQAEKIRSQAEELETLDSIVRTVNKEVRLTDLLSALLQQTLLLFPNVSVACYFVRSPDDTLFRLVSTVGESVDAIAEHAFSLAELIDDPSNSIQTLQDGVYVLRGLEKNWNQHEASPIVPQRSFMGMSDMQRGSLRGFLVLGSDKNHSFSADDLRRLLRLRQHVSSAVAKAVAIRELEQKNMLLDDSNKQLRDTQQQLIVHEKLAALGELTAGIAHEIQNPLNFVNNFSSISLELMDELEECLFKKRSEIDSSVVNLIDTVRGNCERIREHGMRATSIVSAMLLHTRKGGARRETIPLNEFLDQFVMLSYHGMRMLHPQYELKLHTEYDRSIEGVSISPQEMSRVIVNICNNAWEAAIAKMGESGNSRHPEVVVRSANAGDAVRISIRDNGAGIPADLHSKIFEPFFTTKHSGNNAGLGLSMSYEIVTQMHKGKLTLESESGNYAEFVIHIPKE
ncbi:MAG: ATP-binding protein [Bacteroidota bacterium]